MSMKTITTLMYTMRGLTWKNDNIISTWRYLYYRKPYAVLKNVIDRISLQVIYNNKRDYSVDMLWIEPSKQNTQQTNRFISIRLISQKLFKSTFYAFLFYSKEKPISILHKIFILITLYKTIFFFRKKNGFSVNWFVLWLMKHSKIRGKLESYELKGEII
jgi:hypothetical protein